MYAFIRLSICREPLAPTVLEAEQENVGILKSQSALSKESENTSYGCKEGLPKRLVFFSTVSLCAVLFFCVELLTYPLAWIR